MNAVSQGRRRNWPELSSGPERPHPRGLAPHMVLVQSSSNTMTSEKDEQRLHGHAGLARANFNTQDLMRMTQLSAGSQLTGAASRTGPPAETTEGLCSSQINDTGQDQSFDQRTPFA